MQQFLFVVEVPANKALSMPPGHTSEWRKFAQSCEPILKTAKACTQLQLNAWLISAEKNWHLLDSLAANATTLDLAYSIVLIPDGAQILTPAFKP